MCYAYGDGSPAGSFTSSIDHANAIQGGNSGLYNYNYFSFNASRCSDRYGNYTEVNPLYNSCKFFIKY